MTIEDTLPVHISALLEAHAGPMPTYEAGAIGSGNDEKAKAPLPPVELDPTEAQHWAKYLRTMDAMVGTHLARLGLTRDELRAGVLPKPEVEASVDDRHAVGEVLQGFKLLVEHIGDAEQGAVLPYAEQEVLMALSVLDREIDAGELHLWLRPEAQEILQPADCLDALDRLAARNAIRVKRLIVGGGASEERFGARTFRFNGCGALLRLYAAPYRAATLDKF